MKLPFLKKHNRQGKEQEEKNLSDANLGALEEHCASELMSAVENKDVKQFRAALEALVLDMFEDEQEGDESNEG